MCEALAHAGFSHGSRPSAAEGAGVLRFCSSRLFGVDFFCVQMPLTPTYRICAFLWLAYGAWAMLRLETYTKKQPKIFIDYLLSNTGNGILIFASGCVASEFGGTSSCM